jgi:hypothetical protein
LPLQQVHPKGHGVPQAPQLLKSFCTSTQAPPQRSCPLGQAQLPPAQLWPPAQEFPHAPQLPALVWVSKHTPPQQARAFAGQE